MEIPSAIGAAQPRATATSGLEGKRAVVLLYSYYPSDVRPRRAAEAMVRAGMQVELICLRQGPEEKPFETVNGVSVRRINIQHQRKGKAAYVLRYGAFLLACFLILCGRCLRRRYDVVHVHNMPDVLVFSSLPAKLLGARVILDLHDPMPELMTSIFGLAETHWMVGWLKRLERWSIGLANAVLTPNVAFRDLFESRSAPAGKVHIVMNSPRAEVFNPDRIKIRPRQSDRFVVMYHGTLVHRHGLHTAVEAMAGLCDKIPGLEFHLYGYPTPYYTEEVLPLAEKLGLGGVIRSFGGQPQEVIAAGIGEADLGIIPNLRSVFTELNMPTRIFEYLALSKPVICPDTKGIRDYFDPHNMLFFEPGSVASLAQKILWVHQHAAEATNFVESGRKIYEEHLWEDEKARFLKLVAELS